MFDGMHVGHQSLFADLRAWADAVGAEPAVVTFDRHPQEVLRGRGPRAIFSLEQRLRLLEREGPRVALLLSFDHEMALWKPEDFVTRALRGALNARYLLLGFDSAFGRDRLGSSAYLGPRAQDLGISIRQAGGFKLEGTRVSSTLVRTALLGGDLAAIERFLGRPYSILGPVVEGDKRGRMLGFPTANVDPRGALVPAVGVYFAEVRRVPAPTRLLDPVSARDPTSTLEVLPSAVDGERWTAVVNVGKRPTFTRGVAGEVRETIEAHLLDFEGDLYGEWLELSFLHRHRAEMPFESPQALAAAIAEDVAASREFSGSRRS
jgi:riboflavin kinase/FMN adenylyltransferase